jgi:hypothetical protein
MPAELINLNEQLLNIKTIYEDALLGDKSIEEIKKLNNQIKQIEKLIEKRKEIILRNQSTN